MRRSHNLGLVIVVVSLVISGYLANPASARVVDITPQMTCFEVITALGGQGEMSQTADGYYTWAGSLPEDVDFRVEGCLQAISYHWRWQGEGGGGQLSEVTAASRQSIRNFVGLSDGDEFDVFVWQLDFNSRELLFSDEHADEIIDRLCDWPAGTAAVSPTLQIVLNNIIVPRAQVQHNFFVSGRIIFVKAYNADYEEIFSLYSFETDWPGPVLDLEQLPNETVYLHLRFKEMLEPVIITADDIAGGEYGFEPTTDSDDQSCYFTSWNFAQGLTLSTDLIGGRASYWDETTDKQLSTTLTQALTSDHEITLVTYYPQCLLFHPGQTAIQIANLLIAGHGDITDLNEAQLLGNVIAFPTSYLTSDFMISGRIQSVYVFTDQDNTQLVYPRAGVANPRVIRASELPAASRIMIVFSEFLSSVELSIDNIATGQLGFQRLVSQVRFSYFFSSWEFDGGLTFAPGLQGELFYLGEDYQLHHLSLDGSGTQVVTDSCSRLEFFPYPLTFSTAQDAYSVVDTICGWEDGTAATQELIANIVTLTVPVDQLVNDFSLSGNLLMVMLRDAAGQEVETFPHPDDQTRRTISVDDLPATAATADLIFNEAFQMAEINWSVLETGAFGFTRSQIEGEVDYNSEWFFHAGLKWDEALTGTVRYFHPTGDQVFEIDLSQQRLISGPCAYVTYVPDTPTQPTSPTDPQTAFSSLGSHGGGCYLSSGGDWLVLACLALTVLIYRQR